MSSEGRGRAARVRSAPVVRGGGYPCVRTISPRSLLLRLVGFGRDCAGAWSRPGPACGARSRPDLCYCGWWVSVVAARVTGLLLKWWRVSGRGRAGARSRPDICLCGFMGLGRDCALRGAARSSLEAVPRVWAGPRGAARGRAGRGLA